MNEWHDLEIIGTGRRGMPLLSDAARAFFDFADAADQAAIETAKFHAAYAAFYTRDRSPWRKRMGRRK